MTTLEGYTLRAEPTAYSKPAWLARWRRNDWPEQEWVTVTSEPGPILYSATSYALAAAKLAASAHRTRFAEPDYPGETVRITRFTRSKGTEFGDVRIQDYMDTMKSGRYKIGTFLPGVIEWSPGDTPKVWPERYEYAAGAPEALEVFERFITDATKDGWELHSEQS